MIRSGEGIWADPGRGEALRSMKEPGSAFEGDRQPAHMSDYFNTIDDTGGVHINSGIPNKAMHGCASELRRIYLPRARVNKPRILLLREASDTAAI
jgi:Zn-dependent metalloprotease